MKLREKIKSYSFWVSLSSAVILILKVLGSRFGFVIDETMVSDLFTAMCSILVILGIIVVPQQPVKETYKEEQKNEIIQNDSTNISGNVSLIDNQSETTVENVVLGNIIQPTETTKTELIETSIIDTIQDDVTTYNAETNQSPSNENTETNITEVNEETIQEIEYNKSEKLLNILKVEKDKYSNNLNEFIKILQHEINITNIDKEA